MGSDTPQASGAGQARDQQAQELARLWQTLSRRHVSLGAGCACGMGGITLRLQDSEQDIVDYLLADAEKGRREDVVAYLNAEAAGTEEGMWDLARLLASLDEQQGSAALPAQVRSFLLERLNRTLRSLAELHGGGARA